MKPPRRLVSSIALLATVLIGGCTGSCGILGQIFGDSTTATGNGSGMCSWTNTAGASGTAGAGGGQEPA